MRTVAPGDAVPDITYVDEDGDDRVLTDVAFLASATSRRNAHHWRAHDSGAEFAPEGSPCQACRWFEAAIYRSRTSGHYALVTAGLSAVPGEEPRRRTRVTDSAFEVVEWLTQHEPGRAPRLPRASALVLARAAEHDDGVREAYVNRAVA